MKKGENIYQRKDGRYEGRYPIGFDEAGKKKYKSVYGKDKKEVRQKLSELQSIYGGTDADMTFKAATQRWLESQSNSRATTLSTYTSMVEGYIIPILEKYTLRQIDVKVKQNFVNTLQRENLSERSIRAYVQIVDRIIEFNTSRKGLDFGDCSKKPKTEVDILSVNDWKKLIYSIKTDVTPIKLGIACICFLGMRVGEVCALKWENIDFEARTVTIERAVERVKSQKGEKNSTRLAIMDVEPRVIPIPAVLFQLFMENRVKKENYFIITASTKLKEPRTFQYSMSALLDKIGIPKCTPKTIRNTFAVKALEVDINVKSLAYVMGIKIDMLEKYFEFIEVDNEKEMQKIK